jgi:hypothetical protein
MAAMTTPAAEPAHLHHIGVESFGVRIVIAAPSPELLRRTEAVLPPGSRAIDPTEDDHHFLLRARENGTYRVEYEDGSVSGSSDLAVALEVLAAQVRAYVALHAPARIFVHAGVVGHRGRAIVLPGLSFSGKTTLVVELVAAGATYYSDEFAVLDGDGLVHPFPKPLSIRTEGVSQVDHDISTFGGVIGDDALPIGLIALAQFVPGRRWEPARLSAGQAVLSMLSNTVPAQERPEQSLAAIKRAVDGAVVLQGERGEAAEVARELLAMLAPDTSVEHSSSQP